jgi:hypothetical protein
MYLNSLTGFAEITLLRTLAIEFMKAVLLRMKRMKREQVLVIVWGWKIY